MKAKVKKSKAVKSTRRGKYAGKSKTSTKTLDKSVKRVVNRMAETKVANYSVDSFSGVPVTSTAFSGTIKILSPASGTGGLYFINQGTGQGSRVGNSISTTKCILSGVVRVNTFFDSIYNYNPCPIYVVLYVCRLRGALEDTTANMQTVINSNFFQAGNSSTGFTGRLNDMTRNINKDQVDLLYKRAWKVGCAQYVSGFAVNSPNNSNNQFADNGGTIARLFKCNLTKCLYKKYNFNDGDNLPTTRKTYIFFVPFRSDGSVFVTSTGNTLGPQPFYVDFNVDYYFKDI